MKNVLALTAALALCGSATFAGNPDVVAQDPVVMSDAIDDTARGSLGGPAVWVLVGGALVLAAVIAADDDESASGT